MRSVEDKEITTGSANHSEFNKSNASTRGRGSSHHLQRTALGKPTPSKWDDAQKWLAGLSRGGGGGDKHTCSRTKPRNSNADDTRLIAPVPQNEIDYPTEDKEADHQVPEAGEEVMSRSLSSLQFEVQTKNVDSEESYWGVIKPMESSSAGVIRPVSVRDMGTEMTPSVSQEPSRTATPMRATTPVRRSPVASEALTPINCQNLGVRNQSIISETHHQNGPTRTNRDDKRGQASSSQILIGRGNEATREEGINSVDICGDLANSSSSEPAGTKINPLETRAIAWDEAERAKYMARYKREEVRIQAWENHEKRKAEMQMKKMEAKAERLKARAQEKYANKLASTRRVAEEKRAIAETKLNEMAVKTSEKADYIRRTGHLPCTLCLCRRLPSFSLCW